MRQYQHRKSKMVIQGRPMAELENWTALAVPGEVVVALETDSHIQLGEQYTVQTAEFYNGGALYGFGTWNRFAYRFKLLEPEEISCL